MGPLGIFIENTLSITENRCVAIAQGGLLKEHQPRLRVSGRWFMDRLAGKLAWHSPTNSQFKTENESGAFVFQGAAPTVP